jgi:hypothetical protein
MINKLVFLFSVIAAKSSWAVSDTDLFKDVEKKGNVLIDFLTSGWFAFAITSAALIYVITAILQGKMELIRGFIIVGACFLLSNVPTIAEWIIG